MQAFDLYTRHRLNTEDFKKMVDAGIFEPGERVELIQGDIVDMAPVGSAHASIVDYLNQALVSQTTNLAIVRVQSPVSIDKNSEPQPDLSLLKPRDDYYRFAHPQTSDIIALIEVSDSSTQYDREIKLPLYAKNGINEVWLILIEKQCIEIYRSPNRNDGKYQNYKVLVSGDATIEKLNNVIVNVDALFSV